MLVPFPRTELLFWEHQYILEHDTSSMTQNHTRRKIRTPQIYIFHIMVAVALITPAAMISAATPLTLSGLSGKVLDAHERGVKGNFSMMFMLSYPAFVKSKYPSKFA